MQRLRLMLLPLAFCYAIAGASNPNSHQTALCPTANHTDRFQIFQSVWVTIRTVFDNDLDMTKGLYTQLSKFIQSGHYCSSDSKGVHICELQMEVRRHLCQMISKRLIDMYNMEENIASYADHLAGIEDPTVLQQIHLLTTRDNSVHHTPEALMQRLYKIYVDNNVANFKMMIEAQLAFYGQFQRAHKLNEDYLLQLAYMISKIQSNPLYINIGLDLENRLLELQKSLPVSMSNLFDTPGFCLLNRGNWEMLYTTATDKGNYGEISRIVYSWYQPNTTDIYGVMRLFPLQQHSSGSYSSSLPLFNLRGEYFKWYYFMDTSANNRIAVWRTGNPHPVNSNWSIQFVDNTWVFRQNDLTLCSAERYDDKRRIVKLLPGELSMPPSNTCRWVATKCKTS